MRKINLLAGLIPCLLLLTQSCKKNEIRTGNQSPVNSQKRITVDEITDAEPADGVYKITSVVSGKAVGVVGTSTGQSALIEQRDFSSNKGQEWRLTKIAANTYTLTNVNSAKVMDVPWGTPDENEQLWQYTLANPVDNAQKWVIQHIGSGIYRFKCFSNQAKGMHVDDANPSSNGGKVEIRTFAGSGAAQQQGYFSIYRVAYKDKVATDFFRRTSGWTAGDGALSFPLDDGRTLWNFGDCHQNDYSNGTVACFFNVNSIALVQASGSWATGTATTLLGPTVDGRKTLYRSSGTLEYFNWPICGVQLGDTAYTFTDLFHYTHIPAGTTQMVHDKPQWAKLRVSTITNNASSKVAVYKDLPAGVNSSTNGGIEFGFGVIKGTDGKVYVYGRKRIFIHAEVYLARFAQNAPNGAWEFYKPGTASWVNDVTQSGPIGEAPSNSLHVSKVNNKYVLLSSEFALSCNEGKNIYAATSNNLTGPFPAHNSASHKVIYTIDERLNGNSPKFYLPIAHPQFTANNELLVIYSIGGYEPCSPDCTNNRKDPDSYRPKGIRVPLKLIDPTF